MRVHLKRGSVIVTAEIRLDADAAATQARGAAEGAQGAADRVSEQVVTLQAAHADVENRLDLVARSADWFDTHRRDPLQLILLPRPSF